MVKPLFDTNILIDYLNAVPQARAEFQRYQQKAISIITWMEVMAGAGSEVESSTRAFLDSRSSTSTKRSRSGPSIFAGATG